jgi:Bacterial Ig domain
MASTDEDTLLVIPDAMLLGNDTDAEDNTLAISAVTGATHGTVSHTGNQVTYTPDNDYHGPATFTYTVTDGFMTGTASVALTVVSVNDVPVAVNDTASTEEDGQLLLVPEVTILLNDTDADNDVLTVQSVAATANTHGTVMLVTPVSGTLVLYVPTPNFAGTADFTYTVSDGNGGTATATVTVTVSGIDDAPVAVNDTATMDEDTAATPIDVLVNDTDVDGGARAIVSVAQPTHGSVVITGGGTALTYVPAVNYCNLTAPPPLAGLPGLARMLGSAGIFAPAGPDTFTYTLSPGGSTATVSVTVNCVDDPPIAVNDDQTVAQDSAGNQFDLTLNDTDIDGGARTIASVTQPGHGAVTVTGSGLIAVYTPAAGYCNQLPGEPLDTFTYTLTPGTSSATVSVTVTCTCGQDRPTDFIVVGSN